jgi:hypothetical protein
MERSEKIERLLKYLDAMNADYVIDYNPSPEKIDYIRKQIAKNNRLYSKVKMR